MLKQLRIICAMTLLASMSLLSMHKEADDIDEFAQAKEFHERLQHAYYGVLQDGVRSYYKKISPITSNLIAGADMWRVDTISIAGEKIYENDDGFYTHGDISFILKLKANFNPTQPLDILMANREKLNTVRFDKFVEKRSPGFPRLKCYNDVLNAIRNEKLFMINYVTLKGVTHILGESPCVILIECQNQCIQPITLRGIEIVCSKDEKKTKIFFDFTDNTNKVASYFMPIECKHSVITNKNEEVIYGFFKSLEMRNKWVPDESNFYDLDNHVLTSLPHFYSNSDDHQVILNESRNWLFDNIDINDLPYQVPNEVWELIILTQNNYSIIEPDMPTVCKAAIQWCAMKRIVNISLVCKKFNKISRKLLLPYTKEIRGYIDKLREETANTTTFVVDGIWWFKVNEICKAMEASLNTIQNIEVEKNNAPLTQAIQKKNTHTIEHLECKDTDTKHLNQQKEILIDLTYANGLLEEARIIKDQGEDSDDKYEYKNGNFICKQGQGGQAYAPQQVDNLNAANNNPPPIPPQTFSFASWITKSSSYLFLAGISASAVAYWVYTKYRAVDESEEEEDDYLEADVESEDCLNEVSVCTMLQ